MGPNKFCAKSRQAGDAIIEALVGMLILGLVVAGTVTGLSRAAKLQNSNNLRVQVVDQLRATLMTNGVSLCGTNFPVAAGKQSLAATVSCTPYAGVLVSFVGVPASVAAAVAPTQAQIMTATVSSPLTGGTLTVSSQQ